MRKLAIGNPLKSCTLRRMSSFVSQLPLAPLGAGDLIDRAVRLYRRHLLVLIRTAAPPVIIVAAGWIILSISVRRLFVTTETNDLVFYGLLTVFSLGLMLAGYLFMLVVMGGATRTLVAHLLRNEPVTARATYAAVKARFWGLLGASTIVMIWISASSTAGIMAGYMVLLVFIFASLLFVGITPWITTVVALIGTLLASALGLWIFFMIVARVAYVPQVMLVEGKGVFDAVGRSFMLASGNVRRLMAMTLFTTFGIMSAMLLLLFIIGFVGTASGVNMRDTADWPVWYAVLYS